MSRCGHTPFGLINVHVEIPRWKKDNSISSSLAFRIKWFPNLVPRTPNSCTMSWVGFPWSFPTTASLFPFYVFLWSFRTKIFPLILSRFVPQSSREFFAMLSQNFRNFIAKPNLLFGNPYVPYTEFIDVPIPSLPWFVSVQLQWTRTPIQTSFV